MDRALAALLCARAAPLDEASRPPPSAGCCRMLPELDTVAFLSWLTAAHQSERRRFVRGLRDDFGAVYVGIALPWSQGQVDGLVHQLKLVKRAMYGRGASRCSRGAGPPRCDRRVCLTDPSRREPSTWFVCRSAATPTAEHRGPFRVRGADAASADARSPTTRSPRSRSPRRPAPARE
jgi:hypothetical protein